IPELTELNNNNNNNNNKRLVRFEISDTGIGLSDVEQNKLFKRFSQADGSTTRKYGGTGLGLSISKCLVNMMGGDIGVKSHENGGSVFWFTLDIDKVQSHTEPALPERHDSALIPQFKARVLVVEDNFTNQMVAQAMLEEFGIESDVAADGQEALDALTKFPYDLVFMDCQMPIMDGYQATKHIRAQHSCVLNPLIPIVAMTANAMQGDREKCINAGMNDFISKPVDQDKLKESLFRWIKNKSQD
ncbi:MAG: response regulator, partial [Saccharospirillaceae bacterium]|nr:response regulator [Pseudomonadales bacterium]NRB80191.1 response regulator [Saccharospirillaceae bacterium]